MSEHSSSYGENFKVTLGGTSHGPEIRVAIEGLPEGTVIDFAQLDSFMMRRAAAGFELSTERREPDNVVFRSGVANFGGAFGIVTGSSVEAYVENTDVRSEDYEAYRYMPRPGHADFTSVMKDGDEAEIAGGGRFSGRLTVGLCIAGGIAKQILEGRGIRVDAEILSIAGDRSPLDFYDIIEAAKVRGDSVGGIIECVVTGLKPGSCGDNLWDGMEGRIAKAVYGIPAVKGVEFGSGFKCTELLGSENNDAFFFDEEGRVMTKTNNHGGILGGIATGMPLVMRCAVKPTPSIQKEQETVDLRTGENVKISVGGRHDPCIVPRALPCVEAAVAIAVLDALLEEERSKDNDSAKLKGEESRNDQLSLNASLDCETACQSNDREDKAETALNERKTADNIENDKTKAEIKKANEVKLAEAREIIDEQNRTIADALKKRFDAAKIIAEIKRSEGMPVKDEAREKAILDMIAKTAEQESPEYRDEITDIFRRIIEQTRSWEEKNE